jgi:hypothetical protein
MFGIPRSVVGGRAASVRRHDGQGCEGMGFPSPREDHSRGRGKVRRPRDERLAESRRSHRPDRGKGRRVNRGLGRLGSVAGLLLFAAVLLGYPHALAAQQIGFGPPTGRGVFQPEAHQEFRRLFTTPGEWSFAASHLAGMGVTAFYVDHAPDSELEQLFGFLASRHINLGVSLLALPVQNCGRGVEGMVASVEDPLRAVRKMRRLGANVVTFALDEPLTFGHMFRGRNACNYSIDEVARRLALTIRAVRAIYPNARIADTEAPTDEPPDQWARTFAQWLDDYQAATGMPLYSFGMDLLWGRPYWPNTARLTVNIAHAHGVKVGVIVTALGSGPEVTDATWMAAAQQHARAIWALKLPLDQVVISSWTRNPTHLLPETNPLSLTALIDWYVRHRP